MTLSDCNNVFNKLEVDAQKSFNQCKQKATSVCEIDISNAVNSNRRCFLANRLEIDYTCEGNINLDLLLNAKNMKVGCINDQI